MCRKGIITRKLKIYYVNANSVWYLVKAYNKKDVLKDSEYKSWIKEIRLATDNEIELFVSLKGEISEAEIY